MSPRSTAGMEDAQDAIERLLVELHPALIAYEMTAWAQGGCLPLAFGLRRWLQSTGDRSRSRVLAVLTTPPGKRDEYLSHVVVERRVGGRPWIIDGIPPFIRDGETYLSDYKVWCVRRASCWKKATLRLAPIMAARRKISRDIVRRTPRRAGEWGFPSFRRLTTAVAQAASRMFVRRGDWWRTRRGGAEARAKGAFLRSIGEWDPVQEAFSQRDWERERGGEDLLNLDPLEPGDDGWGL